MDPSSISVALTSLKAAKDIAQTMISLRDTAAFQDKVIEFQSKILDAQQAALSANEERAGMLETISNLEQEVADLKAWETEKQRYELKSVGNGTFAYVLKEDTESSEPFHFLCTKCYEDRKKSILQPSPQPATAPPFQGGRLYSCHSCSSRIVIPWETANAR